MTMLPPFLPQSIRYGQNAFPDVEPFSLRAAASYEEIQYSVVAWIRDQLQPWMDDNGSASPWAASLVDQVNAALAAQSADYASRYGEFFIGTITAPAPTGDPTIDTPNLIAAFQQAADTYSDLILAPSPLGAIRWYKCSTPLIWNLNRGSLRGHGLIGIDFSAVSTSYVGAGFTVGSNTTGVDGAHQSTTHKVEGIRFAGHDTDTSLMDGLKIIESAAGFGNDMGTIESCYFSRFHDNLTFGVNTWNFDFRKCTFDRAHRYNINLTGGTGECQQFTECNVFGATNAAGTAANIFSPAGQSVDVRFYGGSFDYPGGGSGIGNTGTPQPGGTGGIQGIIQGGNSIMFDKVHFEDSNATPMFTYQNNNVGTVIDVTFRDCSWSLTGNAPREQVHQILSSTRDSITIRFSGDHGATTGASAKKWIYDGSGSTTGGIVVTYDAFRVINNGGVTPNTALQLGNSFNNLLTNGNFETSQAFVSANGLGWTAGAVGTWSIGPGSARGAGYCLQLNGTGTGGTNVASQRVRIAPTRRPIRAAAFLNITSYAAGSVGTYLRFLADDGTTALGSDYRLGTDLSALSDYDGRSRTIMPPAGAAYAMFLCTAASFNGAAQWDDIEIVQL